MLISLIVTTYNRPDALLLVLQSIEHQTLQPDEIIIADDGSDNNTNKLISNFDNNSNLSIFHSFQDDFGFRAAQSRNKAIALAKFDYIVLIDGDMILHPEFINDHVKNAKSSFFIQGSRALLTEYKTNEVINSNQIKLNFFANGIKNRLNSFHSKFLSNLFSNKKNHLKGIKTCNMSFYRKDAISVNGFNNKFIGWGREDSEFIVRMMNKGINRNTLKFSAVQYHLWHNESNKKSLLKNDQLLQNTQDNHLDWCEDGVSKFLE